MFTWILTSVLLVLNLCLWIGNICNGLLLGNASIARGLTCCKKLARHEASRKSWSTKFPLGGEVNHIWPLAYSSWRTIQQTVLKSSVKIPAIRQQLKPIFIFPIISLWHSNQSAYATAVFFFFRRGFLQSFSFIPHIASEELIFNIFRKFGLLVAMTTDQIGRFGQTVYIW